MLEFLNLSGNGIKDLPKAALEPLKCLKTLKISKNKISLLAEVGNLSVLPNLENLSISGNPVCEIEECQLFIAYYLSSIESLDGNIVNNQIKQKANKKYAGPAPETWVIRENLVSFRRTISDKNQEKKEMHEEIVDIDNKIEKNKQEIEFIDKKIDKNCLELENIEGAFSNTNDSENSKKNYMRDLLDKTENLRDSSVNLQEKQSHARTILQEKKEALEAINRKIPESKLSEKEFLIEEKCKIGLEITEIEENIEELEAQYGLVLEELNLATSAITSLEEEILSIRSTPEAHLKKNKYKKEPKKESSFTMDNDTKAFLTTRKNEIIQEMPELKLKKQQLGRELETLLQKKESKMLDFRDLEREILEVTRQASECEEYLQKVSTPSPIRSRANTRLMWDCVKGLWHMVTDNPWEYESDDIQKGIIRWAEHMKEHLNRKKIDQDHYLQIMALQRTDQATISNLNSKIHDLTQQILQTSKLNDEIDKLNAKIDGYKEKEKNWAQEKQGLLEALKKLENSPKTPKTEDFEKEKSDLIILSQQKISLQENIRLLNESSENQEKEIKARLQKLKSYCDGKAQELYKATEEYEGKVKLLDSVTGQIEELQRTREDLIAKIQGLNASKNELEKESWKIREGIQAIRPLKAAEEDRDKAFTYLKHIVSVLGLDVAVEKVEFKELFKIIQNRLDTIKEDIEKAEKFKINKEKFIEMYEINTKELHDEWNNLKIAKEEIEIERQHIQSVKSEKKNLDDQMKQLVQTTKELQRIKNSLEKEKIRLEENLNSLKQSTETFETLKQKEMGEYHRIQALHDSETAKLEENLQELKALKAQIKEFKAEKIEIEAWVTNSKQIISKLEEKKRNTEEDIKNSENILYKLANKLTEEQAKAHKDLEKVKILTEDKVKEIKEYENLIRTHENQAARAQDQSSLALQKIESLNDEIQEKERIVQDKKIILKELDSKCISAEQVLERSRKENELLNQSFSSKRQKISQLELEILTKTEEFDKINTKYEQGASEMHAVEKQIQRIKSDLQGIEQIITKKNHEYENINHALHLKALELKDLEKELGDKYMALSRAEQQLSDIHTQACAEEESILVFKEEARTLQTKINKLTETLKRVEGQKHQVLVEIDEINSKVAGEENRHRKEIENLRNAVSNGESTLRQLMESVQRCRNKLSTDKEESSRLTDTIIRLNQEKDSLNTMLKGMESELIALKEEINKLKVEEDTALVLLALSGHRIDDKIKQRITSLCKSASELEALKSKIHESNQRDFISETRLRQPSRSESYENTSIYDKPIEKYKETRHPQEFLENNIPKSPEPELDDMKKLLHTLEVTQQRLKSLTPINELSYEQ